MASSSQININTHRMAVTGRLGEHAGTIFQRSTDLNNENHSREQKHQKNPKLLINEDIVDVEEMENYEDEENDSYENEDEEEEEGDADDDETDNNNFIGQVDNARNELRFNLSKSLFSQWFL